MRGFPCTVCQRADLNEVDAFLMSGGKLIPGAAKFSIKKSTLHNHKRKCLAPKIAAAAKLVAPGKEIKAQVERAKAIAAGAAPTIEEVLSLTGLLERLARSLDRLEGSAKVAAGDNLHTAHAALAGQLHRGIEAAGKLKGYYSDAPSQGGGEKFSISINLPATAPATRPIIDCTPAPKASAPVPRVPSNFAIGLDLSASLDASLDAVEALDSAD
jgi:hypothetical protein